MVEPTVRWSQQLQLVQIIYLLPLGWAQNYNFCGTTPLYCINSLKNPWFSTLKWKYLPAVTVFKKCTQSILQSIVRKSTYSYRIFFSLLLYFVTFIYNYICLLRNILLRLVLLMGFNSFYCWKPCSSQKEIFYEVKHFLCAPLIVYQHI